MDDAPGPLEVTRQPPFQSFDLHGRTPDAFSSTS